MSSLAHHFPGTSTVYYPRSCLNPLLFFFFFILGLHLQHMKVPRLGFELELQLQAYTTATATQDPSTSVTYEVAYGNVRS